MGPQNAFIGTAGWAIPRAVANSFPGAGSGLERYAAVFDAVEINSTFYRSHRASTYGRWAGVTPDHFRFAIKAPRAITHDAKLVDGARPLAGFLSELEPMRHKIGTLLVQLPPSLVFDQPVAEAFFGKSRERQPELPIACEPRHTSWFSAQADDLLAQYRVARVAADPARHALAGAPGGWLGLAYYRLHGAPVMYRSIYGPAAVAGLADRLASSSAETSWCIFDNTTLGGAAADALELRRVSTLSPALYGEGG